MTRTTLLLALATLVMVPAAAVLFSPRAASSGPEPILYERDTCARCRMHFGATGFAAERRDASGTLKKYDDIGCMLVAASHDASGDAWVEDHGGSGFVPLLSATLVAGDDLRTPMGYGVVAFRDPNAAEAFARAHHARVVSIEQLLRDEARFAAQQEVPR